MRNTKRSIQSSITIDGMPLIWRLHREQNWTDDQKRSAWQFMSRWSGWFAANFISNIQRYESSRMAVQRPY